MAEKIAMFIISNNSELSQKVERYAINVATKLNDHPRYKFWTIITPTAGPSQAEFVKRLKIKTFPTIVFAEAFDDGLGKIATIRGASTEAQIEKVFTKTLNGDFKLGTGSGTDANGNPFIPGWGTGDGFGFGFGLFQMPRFGWPILGALLTYKAVDSKTPLGQAGFGSAAAYCWYQHVTHLDG